MNQLFDILRDGMAKNSGNPALCHLGELLTDWVMHHPGKTDPAGIEGKTLQGAMDAMRTAAGKQKQGNMAVISDVEGLRIALEYFGVNQETQPPADSLDLDAFL